MAQISASIAGGSLMPAVQKRAFPLAGLMCTLRGIAHAHEGKAGITVPANASSSFSRRGDEESFETSTRACEGEFCESIKKGSAYRSDHQQENQCYSPNVAAKSATGRENLSKQKAIPDAESVFFCIVATAHLSNAGKIRTLSMVALVGLSSDRPVSFCTGILTPANVTAILERENSGGDSLKQKEAAYMLATTPTQNPQFIWLIAAVRRDMPTITAKIHHIAAPSEHEARRTLARDHVCFFAGRIRLEVAA
ncbi:host cell division inhibitor Icd-like protein [Citrobacter portucalensis]|uniref:host cell division inhibitor Icd-like protein n=1 Tax=Citrobacter portucalensis TaxID=1639133 RepID=UPI002542E166|nr:host cell division inhibitor Icd-like protein [Citrobacter portucalensis]WIJ59900.1 host cell division inhibitor Icd-like protein [Citrobacter portucalensis]